MDEKTENILNTFKKLGTIGHKDILKMVPLKDRKYKCHVCHSIIDTSPCPKCGNDKLEQMCPLDNCNCHHEMVGQIEYCPLCGEAICPVDNCFCHDVLQVSRVTGYLADVEGFNRGKRAELLDRHRYNITN